MKFEDLKRLRRDKQHPLAVDARQRVSDAIDSISPQALITAIKNAPSLRGMVLGFVSEVMYEEYLQRYPDVSDIRQHDDHDRTMNKADRDFLYKDRRVSVQLKSIQTNTIGFDPSSNNLIAQVQNDASDSRKIMVEGREITTVNYLRGQYDLLCTPIFPFTGDWRFAYKLNSDCEVWRSRKYPKEIAKNFLHGMEVISFPELSATGWIEDLDQIMQRLPTLT